MSTPEIFQQWRHANQQAKAAEDAMYRQSLRALEGAGEPPGPELAAQVKCLQSEAARLFGLVMEQLGRAIEDMQSPFHGAQGGNAPTPPPQPS